MSNKAKITLTLLLVGIFFAISTVIWHQKNTAQHFPAQLLEKQPTIGDSNAEHHIIVFEDLKCNNCAVFSSTVLSKIKKTYVKNNKASLTLVTLAFIPGSKPAGNAALCLYQQNPSYFFDYVEYIYRHQPNESDDWATATRLIKFAQSATPHADLNSLADCIIQERYHGYLEHNLTLARKVMGNDVRTPAVFVDNKPVQPTLEHIKNALD